MSESGRQLYSRVPKGICSLRGGCYWERCISERPESGTTQFSVEYVRPSQCNGEGECHGIVVEETFIQKTK